MPVDTDEESESSQSASVTAETVTGSSEPGCEGFEFRITPDRMWVVVSGLVTAQNVDMVVRRILEELVRAGLGGVRGANFVTEWLRHHITAGSQLNQAVLLEGRRPRQPVDGRIEWAQDFFSTGFVMDEATGAIDYRQHSAQRSVEPGQRLARLIAAEAGEDGEDVFGRPIPVRKPRVPVIRIRRNVHEDSGVYYSDAVGRIGWEPLDRNAPDLAGLLSVDDVYTIEGSVDLETGNIKHPGALVVEKDIEQGSVVETEGDIEVKGVVEAAVVRTRGNLTVRGGIAGGHGAKIEVGGSLHARFILDADIEAGGDVVIEREIMHSSVKTCGAVMAPNARVIGGRVMALCGVTVGFTGSEASVPTVLIAGEDYQLAPRLAAKEAEVVELEKRGAKMDSVLHQHLPRVKLLKPDRRQALARLVQERRLLAEAIEEARGAVEAMKESSRERAQRWVVARKHVYPETVFVLGHDRFKVSAEFHGPVAARLNEGKIELGSAPRAQGSARGGAGVKQESSAE